MHDAVGRAGHPCAERLDQEFQDDCHEPVRQVGEDFGKAVLDGLEATGHAPLERREIFLLPSLVLPTLQRGGQEIEFGKNIAEPRREHFLTLERAAQRQQRHVGAQSKCRRIARELAIEPRCVAGIGRRGKQPAAPASAPGAEHRRKTVADMFPERLVEGLQPLGAIGFAERVHLLEQIGMRADCALPEHDQIAGQDIGALDSDADRHRAIEIAKIILRPIDHGLAAMDVHGVIDRDPHSLGGVQLHDAGNDGGMMPLVERGTGQPPRGVKQIGRAGDAGERLLDAFELADGNAELFANAGIGTGGARRIGHARSGK